MLFDLRYVREDVAIPLTEPPSLETEHLPAGYEPVYTPYETVHHLAPRILTAPDGGEVFF